MIAEIRPETVLEYLRAIGWPLSRLDLAERLDMTERQAQLAICRLVIDGYVDTVGHCERSGLPTYCPVTVGPCEWCGLVDHHLVFGECRSCQVRVRKSQEVIHAN